MQNELHKLEFTPLRQHCNSIPLPIHWKLQQSLCACCNCTVYITYIACDCSNRATPDIFDLIHYRAETIEKA